MLTRWGRWISNTLIFLSNFFKKQREFHTHIDQRTHKDMCDPLKCIQPLPKISRSNPMLVNLAPNQSQLIMYYLLVVCLHHWRHNWQVLFFFFFCLIERESEDHRGGFMGLSVCLLKVSPLKGTVFNCVWRVCLFCVCWPPWVHADGALNNRVQQGSRHLVRLDFCL